jgi:hypothetical protein
MIYIFFGAVMIEKCEEVVRIGPVAVIGGGGGQETYRIVEGKID